MTYADICAAVVDGVGMVSSGDLIETSGVAASRRADDIIWAHNDSGDTARVFALGIEEIDGRMHARQHATYSLPGVEAIDWEDMAIGPGPERDVPYLYLADVGDNNAVRPEVYVYRVPEPEVTKQPDTPTAHDFSAEEIEQLKFVYPDRPHDAEIFMVDPMNGDLLIITKELSTNVSFVFRALPSVREGDRVTLDEIATIDFTQLRLAATPGPDAPALPRGVPLVPTGGDISPDASIVAIRTYGGVFVWERPGDATMVDVFAAAPCEAPSAIEQQGEAIAFDADGRGYFTISEGQSPPFHHFSGAE